VLSRVSEGVRDISHAVDGLRSVAAMLVAVHHQLDAVSVSLDHLPATVNMTGSDGERGAVADRFHP
jgi:hypothetical protein